MYPKNLMWYCLFSMFCVISVCLPVFYYPGNENNNICIHLQIIIIRMANLNLTTEGFKNCWNELQQIESPGIHLAREIWFKRGLKLKTCVVTQIWFYFQIICQKKKKQNSTVLTTPTDNHYCTTQNAVLLQTLMSKFLHCALIKIGY